MGYRVAKWKQAGIGRFDPELLFMSVVRFAARSPLGKCD
jgi:hypothetical protein